MLFSMPSKSLAECHFAFEWSDRYIFFSLGYGELEHTSSDKNTGEADIQADMQTDRQTSISKPQSMPRTKLVETRCQNKAGRMEKASSDKRK